MRGEKKEGEKERKKKEREKKKRKREKGERGRGKFFLHTLCVKSKKLSQLEKFKLTSCLKARRGVTVGLKHKDERTPNKFVPRGVCRV